MNDRIIISSEICTQKWGNTVGELSCSCTSTNSHCLVCGLHSGNSFISENVVVSLLAVLQSGPVVPPLAIRSGVNIVTCLPTRGFLPSVDLESSTGHTNRIYFSEENNSFPTSITTDSASHTKVVCYDSWLIEALCSKSTSVSLPPERSHTIS